MSANVSAKDVMALRQRTGLGMMDCKEALMENDGDMEKAIEWLRAKLKGKMDERADRAMAQGRLAIATAPDRKSLAIVEINVETDFTARNEMVEKAANDIASLVLAGPAGEASANEKIAPIIDNIRITTGENTVFKRGLKLQAPCCGSYLHFDNQKAAVITFDGEVDAETAKGICMHIVSHKPEPQGISDADVPADLIARQRELAKAEAMESGKPAEIAEKMVEGKIRKFVGEITLLNQKYVRDPEGKQSVKDVLPKGVKVTRFLRFEVGR
ncbi:MAG: translation elongation factor Ts [Phycisphaerales bacterium]|nr:translation elongation factor Ts [Phycisphaerales bacterium]